MRLKRQGQATVSLQRFLSRLREKVKPGVKTKDLDKLAEEITEKEAPSRHLRVIVVILTLSVYR